MDISILPPIVFVSSKLSKLVTTYQKAIQASAKIEGSYMELVLIIFLIVFAVLCFGVIIYNVKKHGSLSAWSKLQKEEKEKRDIEWFEKYAEESNVWNNAALHSHPDQIRRQLRIKYQVKPELVDADNGIYHIKGSETNHYSVSLNDCTCKDFSERGLPCKHMYALAAELGIFKPSRM